MNFVRFKPIWYGRLSLHRALTFSLELNRVFPVKTAEIDERSV